MKKRIWLSPPHMSGDEQKYIQKAFDTNYIAPVGGNIDKFEIEIQNSLGHHKQIVALNSGTSAIHIALKLANVQKGDTVICQSFTFVATANPILYQHAIPVFVDSERDTWNMCPELLEKAIRIGISNNKKPKAIIVVHGYGMPAKLDEIVEISKKYNIVLIEDAAAAFGSTYNDKKCGSVGDYGIISFNGNKIITTSAGGALICNTKKEKYKSIYWATQANDGSNFYEHNQLGYNYRMSNVLAGIGRGQLKVLVERVQKRRANFEYYKQKLSQLPVIKFLREPNECFSNRWLSCILVSSFNNREKIRIALEKEQIESRPLWKPMHQQTLYKKYESYTNGVSDELFKKGLCLPSGSNLSINDLERIVQIIKNINFNEPQ